MTTFLRITLSIAFTLTLAGTFSGCSSDKKSNDEKTAEDTSKKTADDATATSWNTVPGEAGGTLEETIQASATVSGIDKATRKVTLTNQDGTDASFTAPAAMQNFDQVRVGDKVTATVNSRLVVFVKSGSTPEASPDATHAAALITAPKGAKPGAIVAEGFELTAMVKAIDTETRRATLEFVDGSTRIVPIRQDVDLSKYKVGDSLVIRVTQHLKVVTETP